MKNWRKWRVSDPGFPAKVKMDKSTITTYLKTYEGPAVRIMEICGSHTAAIAQSGMRAFFSDNIRMISGPGCPVCVTVTSYIDRLIALSEKDSVICSFGDLIRVPGSRKTLEEAGAGGADIRMLYSPLDMLSLAEKERDKSFCFAAVGFETTTPVYAELIRLAEERGLTNVKLLTSLKTMPKVVDRLGNSVDGYILPGHVCTITGYGIFEEYAEKYGIPMVVSGFEPSNILEAIYALIRLRGRGMVRNFYPSAVKGNGNPKAREAVFKYFEPGNAAWRGLGEIEDSGMYLRREYAERYDAGSFELTKDQETDGCHCASVITGAERGTDCPLFGKACTPSHPVGACMVSREGACFSEYVS